MKRWIVYLIIIPATVLLLFSCSKPHTDMAQLLNISKSQLTKIVIIKGTNFSKTVTLKTNDQLDQFYSLMKSTYTKRVYSPKISYGPKDYIEFYLNDKLSCRVEFGSYLNKENKFYDVSGPLNYKSIDSYFT